MESNTAAPEQEMLMDGRFDIMLTHDASSFRASKVIVDEQVVARGYPRTPW